MAARATTCRRQLTEASHVEESVLR